MAEFQLHGTEAGAGRSFGLHGKFARLPAPQRGIGSVRLDGSAPRSAASDVSCYLTGASHIAMLSPASAMPSSPSVPSNLNRAASMSEFVAG
jgi:hypothetical protein